MSCYAPGWVKRDPRRFPRATDLDGTRQEILTPFASANRDADARAFAALQRHLRETDSAQLNEGAGGRQRVAVRLAPRRLQRQLTKSSSLGNLAFFEVSPPQVGQMPSQESTLLQGQATAER